VTEVVEAAPTPVVVLESAASSPEDEQAAATSARTAINNTDFRTLASL
jgi:hypothetical protein